MSENITIDLTADKAEKYRQLLPQIMALTSTESDRIANLANIAAILKYNLNFFWVGFYIFKEEELVLSAFQGPVACTRIQVGKGVCGNSFEKGETLVVPDVNQFNGHIACSSETKSEIVVPIVKKGKAIAVLDVDSEQLNFFDKVDKQYLEELTHYISEIW